MTVRLSARFAISLSAVALALAASQGPAEGQEGLRDVPIAITTFTPEQLNNAGVAADVLATLNAVRADPKGFAAGVRGRPINIRGISAADRNEALNYLDGQAPLPPLTYSPALSDIAAIHANDIGVAGLTSHTGTDGSSPGGRGRGRGIIAPLTAEELSFGQSSGRDVIWQLIVDPNTPGRPHRRDLFNPVFTFAGAGCAPHRGFNRVCVINLSGPMMTTPPPTSLPPATPGFNFTCPAGENPVELDAWRSQVFGQIRVPYNSQVNRPWRDELEAASATAVMGYTNPRTLDLTIAPLLTLDRNLGLGFGYCAPPAPPTSAPAPR